MRTQLKQLIKVLIKNIEDYLNGKISGDDLEQCTMGLIAEDDFALLKEEVQDIIYALDSKELNELSPEDILKIKKQLQDYIENAKEDEN
jgi:6-pyruvoyl-tetrahydropterin synthase